MRQVISIISLLLIVFGANSQLVRISADEVMNTELFNDLYPGGSLGAGYPDNSKTYRVYAELQDSQDEVIGVFATTDCWSMEISAENGIWNSMFGGTIGPDLNTDSWMLIPENEFDSFVTIGRASSLDAGGPITLSATNPSNYWTNGSNTWTGIPTGPDMTLINGAWWSLQGNVNNRGVGPNHRVLLFQITTSSLPYFKINLQVLNDGSGLPWTYVSEPPFNDSGCANGGQIIDGSALSLESTYGCTNELADNYDSDIIFNDGSCIFTGCTNPLACNFWNIANNDDGSCILPDGCTEISADNYDIDALCDDGSCEYLGCTNNEACNYNPISNVDDGSCNLPDGCTNPNAVNFDINALCDDGSCSYGGCTDPLACNYLASAAVDDGSCTASGSFIYGVVYHDLNNNNLYDTNQFSQESTFSNWAILVEPTNEVIYTDANGNYNFHAAPGITYTITLLDNSDVFDPKPNTQAVAVSGAITCGTQNLNLGILPTEEIYLHVSGPCCIFMMDIHCNNGMQPGLWVHNTGSLPLNGAVTLTYDPILQTEILGGQAMNPSSIIPGQTQWIINNQSPGGQILYQCQMLGPGVDYIGQIFPIYMNIYLEDSQGNEVFNTTYILEPMVVCAYDPNDKYAEPGGYGEPHYILEDDEIEYRIRFQNTGNYFAEDINIIDSLDVELLDLSTFTPRYASHSFLTCYRIDEGIVDFQFENIMLPDSSADLEGSNGYVVYSIKPKPGIAPGSLIENKAYIFFEVNPPVITNTEWHTIYDCTELELLDGMELASICANEELNVEITYPYADSFVWSIDGSNQGPGSSIFQSEMGDPGSHTLGLTASNPLCSRFTEVDVDVLELPIASFTEDGALLSAVDATAWQWYLNGQLIEGATNQTYLAENNGFYSVSLTNEAECSDLSDESFITVVGIEEFGSNGVLIYPNPTSDVINVTFSINNPDREIELVDVNGRSVIGKALAVGKNTSLDCSALSAGNYFLRILENGVLQNSSSVLVK